MTFVHFCPCTCKLYTEWFIHLHSEVQETSLDNWESLEGSVIQATGTVEFEDDLRTGVLQEDWLCPYSGRTTLEFDMARPWSRCSLRAPVQYRQTKFLWPSPALHYFDIGGIGARKSRTGLPWMIPALSIKISLLGKADWHSFLDKSMSWHQMYRVSYKPNQTKLEN